MTRRGWMKAATLGLGAALGGVVGIPALRFLFFPVGRRVVSSSGEPIDVAAVAALPADGGPLRLPIVATEARDAWASSRDVVLGAAWLSKDERGSVRAFSAICPHLGCAVGFDESEGVFRCPCHKSVFSQDGERLSGPSLRGLDPLPTVVEEGRVKVAFRRYRLDTAEREPVG